MRIEVGRVSKEAAQEKVARKQNVYDIQIKDEITSKDGGEEEIVVQQRKIFESTEGHYNEETTPSQETEIKATHVQPIIEHSSLNEEGVHKTFKCLSEGKDFSTSNFQEPDSRRKNKDVKLWAHKESKKNEQIPKRITLQIGSLSRGNTMRFLEAEKARVIRQLKEEREKRLGKAIETRQLVGTRDKTCKELEHTKELAWYGVHEDKEWKALRFDKDRSAEPMDPEQGGREPMVKEQRGAKDWTTEFMVKRRTGYETFSQELTSLDMSGRKTKLKGEKEQRPLDDNRVQPEAKATVGAEEFSFAVELSDQLPGSREQTDATGKQPAPIRPKFEIVKKNDRRATRHCKENKGGTTTSTSHPAYSSDSQNYISCQGEKHAAQAAEVDKARAAQQREGQDEVKELQKRAIFHLEALRRIEETYKSRINREKYFNVWTKRPNEIRLRHPQYRDNSFYIGVPEAQNNQVRKSQKKGQGGLNALLAPVFEEEMQRQWQNSYESSPTNSYTEKQVLKFQRMKKAQLRAAEDQISAIKASVQQRRAQLKATIDKVAKGRATETVNRKEKGISGEYLAQKENFPTKLSQERLFINKRSNSFKTTEQPIKRINELNERARAEEQMQAERPRRIKLQAEETSARLNKAGPGRASIKLCGTLNRNQRIEMLGLLSKVSDEFKSPFHRSQIFHSSNRLKHPQFSPHTANSRFKSPLDSSQKLNGSNRSKHPQLDATVISKFKSPLTSSRNVIKTNALEHFANWEQELRTAQRSRRVSKERSRKRSVTIQEDPLQSSGEREKYELRKRSGATGRLFAELHSKSPKKDYSSETMLSNEAIPDHYNSVDQDCTCELKYEKEKNAKTRSKAIEENTSEIAKGAYNYKKENRQPLNWLGKLYNTITSFS